MHVGAGTSPPLPRPLGSPQGTQSHSHRPENGASAQTENVSWKPDFQPSRMDCEHIGLTAEFPAE